MKKRLLKSLQPLASSIPLRWLVSITGQRLFLPFYHSVQKDKALPHIQHLYKLRTLEEFEKDLDFLLSYYKPIDLAGLFDHLKSGKSLEENTFFLSFDDGLREINDWIAPLLLKKGIPATFFLNADFIDNKDLFFRYKASLLIDHLEQQNISTAKKKILEENLNTPDFKSAILKINFQNKEVLDEIATLLKFDFDAFLKTEKPYLESNQIKVLMEQGFTIGSHSLDHPLYKDIEEAEQIRQTRASQEFINKKFNPEIKTFAFPFTDDGVKASFFKTIQNETIIDLSFGTAGLKNDAVPFHLQRFPVEEFPIQMHELVSAEYFYYFGKSFFGKNKIVRE